MKELTPDNFCQAYPDVFYLPECDTRTLTSYLRSRELIEPEDVVHGLEPAGEGNMNITLRAQAGGRALILKQSLPWVAKYPHIEAPWDRVLREAMFFRLVHDSIEVSSKLPQLVDLDVVSRIAVMEDFGVSTDFSCIYGGPESTPEFALHPTNWKALGHWLGRLHTIDFSPDQRKQLSNRDMRLLNHEHIFHFPLVPENGLTLDDITPGLQAAADALIGDAAFTRTVREIGDAVYLSDGNTLLHGDFFPGSWLMLPAGPRVIDAEFAFFGNAAFDLSIPLAHATIAQIPGECIDNLLAAYCEHAPFDESLVEQLAGIEIMRRIIGVAQLPLKNEIAGLEHKQRMLDTARKWVMQD